MLAQTSIDIGIVSTRSRFVRAADPGRSRVEPKRLQEFKFKLNISETDGSKSPTSDFEHEKNHEHEANDPARRADGVFQDWHHILVPRGSVDQTNGGNEWYRVPNLQIKDICD